jgi:hypothetical protein
VCLRAGVTRAGGSNSILRLRPVWVVITYRRTFGCLQRPNMWASFINCERSLPLDDTLTAHWRQSPDAELGTLKAAA